MKEEGSVKLIL